MIENLSDLYPEQYHDCIYDALRFLPNALCVDIGAADGRTSQRARAASASTRVIAFEPFPGNHEYFRSLFLNDEAVSLETIAVSDREGEATFVVPQVVAGWEPGWESKVGYSSTGFLAGVRSASSYWQRLRRGGLLRWLRQLARRKRPHVIKVRTTTLDKYFGDQAIDFCKIDTQGAEYHVLAGAQRMLREHRIGALYIEFEDNADPKILQILQDSGYRIFGTIFVVVQGRAAVPLEELGLTRLAELQLSNGYTSFDARLAPGMNVQECFDRLLHLGVRFHNDLIAVSPARLAQFEQAMSALAASRQPEIA